MDYHVPDLSPARMAQFHSVKQAAEVTGKSESTIKRLLTSIKNDPDSPDRKHLRPTPDEYEQYKRDGAPFQWEISETLLRDRYPEAFVTGASAKEEGSGSHNSTEASRDDLQRYVRHLEEQNRRLEERNDQLSGQNATLTGSLTALTDRVTQMLGHYQVKALGPVDGSNRAIGAARDDRESETESAPVAAHAKSEPTEKGTRTSRKEQSVFEKHTPTFHKAFSHLLGRQ